MPRKKTSTTATVADATGSFIMDVRTEADLATLEGRLASIAPDDEEGLAARVTKVGLLVLSCDAAGVDVPRSVRQSVPTPAHIVAEAHRLTARITEDEQALKGLKSYVLAYLDRPGCDGGDEYLGADGYGLRRIAGCSAERLSPTRLVELGVDPAVIDRATESGTPYFQVRLVAPKT